MFDVVGKFGEPTKKTESRGQQVLLYSGLQVIKGTVQVQFKLEPATKVIQRIDVYPAPVISAGEIEDSYGHACAETENKEPCYVKKQTAQGSTYFLYAKMGLAIFFKEDGRTVQSFAFLPPAT